MKVTYKTTDGGFGVLSSHFIKHDLQDNGTYTLTGLNEHKTLTDVITRVTEFHFV